MSGKHSKKSSKAPVGLIIILILIALIAGIVVLFYFSQKENKDINNGSSTTASASVQNESASEPYSEFSDNNNQEKTQSTEADASSAVQQSEQKETQESHSAQTPTEKVVVPDSDDADESLYFDAVFTPYKAVDTDTEGNVSLREVFGSSYSGSTFVFNSDGTFTDNLSISSVNSGSYTVNGDTIRATYTNDKNITVSIISRDGNIPSEIVINYGGYDVYFN